MTTKTLARAVYYEVRFPFRFIFYKDDDRWVGHCLETDTVVEGMTPAGAVRNLKTALELQVDDALAKNDVRALYNPAPRECWQLLPQAIPMTHIRRYDSLKKLLERLGGTVRRAVGKGRRG